MPNYLKGFTSDGSTPKNHEFMVVRIPETKLIIESYGGVHARTRISVSMMLMGDVVMMVMIRVKVMIMMINM